MMGIASLLLGNEWARLAGVAVLCFGFGWVRGFDAVPKVDVAEVQRVAMESRDNEWKLRLEEENNAAEQRIAEAIAAGQAEPAVSSDSDLSRLCKSDPACRDKGGNRSKRVQGVQAPVVGN